MRNVERKTALAFGAFYAPKLKLTRFPSCLAVREAKPAQLAKTIILIINQFAHKLAATWNKENPFSLINCWMARTGSGNETAELFIGEPLCLKSNESLLQCFSCFKHFMTCFAVESFSSKTMKKL